jgi:hypothetical protein
VAEGVGFEPTSDVSRCRFSRPVPSTARPPLRFNEIKDFSSPRNLDSASLQTVCKHRPLPKSPMLADALDDFGFVVKWVAFVAVVYSAAYLFVAYAH